MKQVYRASYLAMVIHFIRKTLDHKVIRFKIACREFERRRDKFLEDVQRANPGNPFLAPFFPEKPPEGWKEED